MTAAGEMGAEQGGSEGGYVRMALRPCPLPAGSNERMECLGSLTGRIAHDFNNLLCVILANAELARMEGGENRALNEYLDLVLLAGDRAKGLIRQVLTLSRRQKDNPCPVQLDLVLREVLKLLKGTLPAGIEVATFVAEDLPPVLGDHTQLHQVVMNLCTNAVHAMTARGGRLSLRLESCILPVDAAKVPSHVAPGGYARLVVGDTGHGMDAETLRRMFEPFFSTKPSGEGTGLGLTVVQGIVNDHRGWLDVASQSGQGTTFTLYFPLVSSSI